MAGGECNLLHVMILNFLPFLECSLGMFEGRSDLTGFYERNRNVLQLK